MWGRGRRAGQLGALRGAIVRLWLPRKRWARARTDEVKIWPKPEVCSAADSEPVQAAGGVVAPSDVVEGPNSEGAQQPARFAAVQPAAVAEQTPVWLTRWRRVKGARDENDWAWKHGLRHWCQTGHVRERTI